MKNKSKKNKKKEGKETVNYTKKKITKVWQVKCAKKWI